MDWLEWIMFALYSRMADSIEVIKKTHRNRSIHEGRGRRVAEVRRRPRRLCRISSAVLLELHHCTQYVCMSSCAIFKLEFTGRRWQKNALRFKWSVGLIGTRRNSCILASVLYLCQTFPSRLSLTPTTLRRHPMTTVTPRVKHTVFLMNGVYSVGAICAVTESSELLSQSWKDRTAGDRVQRRRWPGRRSVPSRVRHR
jgi:hypothetical protein